MTTDNLIVIRGLTKTYRTVCTTPWKQASIPALSKIDLDIPASSRIALVGRSGSGKSTLAKCLAQLEKPDAGEIRMEGRDLLTLSASGLKRARRHFQIIFQQSATAFNPRFTALEAIVEPLRIQRIGGTAERRARALEMMGRVGLPAAWAGRSWLQFSGGERQRLALARALILQPKLLILDEAFSGLDNATQQRISQLLLDIQSEQRISYLFITHDLLLASRLADLIAIMEAGRIAEIGTVAAIFQNPCSIAARELIRAIPGASPVTPLFHS